MVITNDDRMAEFVASFRTFGTPQLGYNYRMTELHAAIGRVRLRKLGEQNEQRRRNAAHLDRALSGMPGIAPQRPRPGTLPVYYNYVVRYDQAVVGAPRQRFAEALEAEGVPAPSIYQPLHHHPTFRIRDAFGHGCPFSCPYYREARGEPPRYAEGAFPVAEEIADGGCLEIKIHPPSAEAEMADIAAAFHKVYEHRDSLRPGTR